MVFFTSASFTAQNGEHFLWVEYISPNFRSVKITVCIGSISAEWKEAGTAK